MDGRGVTEDRRLGGPKRRLSNKIKLRSYISMSLGNNAYLGGQ